MLRKHLMAATALVAFSNAEPAATSSGGESVEEARARLLGELDALETAQADTDDAGIPEFGSVTVILDHLVRDHSEEAPVVKYVFGYESSRGALLKQIRYFNELELLTQSDTITTIADAGENAIFIYSVPGRGQTQVIVPIERYAAIMADENTGKGSFAETTAALIQLAHGALPLLSKNNAQVAAFAPE